MFQVLSPRLALSMPVRLGQHVSCYNPCKKGPEGPGKLSWCNYTITNVEINRAIARGKCC